jgi:transposase
LKIIRSIHIIPLGAAQAILHAIVAGERDPVKLAQLRNRACKSNEETIAKALTGTWKQELILVLQPR